MSYDELLDDWRSLSARLETTLGMSWPMSQEASADAIDSYLTPSLRHHEISSDEAGGEPLPKAVQLARQFIDAMAKDAPEAADLQARLLQRVSEELESWGPYVAALRQRVHESASLRSPQTMDARLLVSLLEVTRSPGQRDMFTAYWRSANDQFSDDISARCGYSTDGAEIIFAAVTLHCTQVPEFLRIDPANTPGIFRILSVSVGNVVITRSNLKLTGINGIRLEEREGDLLRFAAEHTDPHFELDLRPMLEHLATQRTALVIKLRFRRDSLATSIIDRLDILERRLGETVVTDGERNGSSGQGQ